MLHELRVQNLALIDSLNFDLSGCDHGLIVLTGETGAGKSIILQAIHLLGGGRSSTSWIRSGKEQALIEAFFEIDPAHREVASLIREYELQDGTSCIIRRLISATGRSKLFINDRLVTARVARELSENLLNISSQHDHQQLLQARRHIDYVDTYGELWGLREQFYKLFTQWQKLSSELRQLLEKEQGKDQRKEFLLYQLEEIEQAAPQLGEDEELRKEKELLNSSAQLVTLASQASDLFSGTMQDQLVAIRKIAEQLSGLDPEVEPLVHRMQSSYYELIDIEQELGKYSQSIPTDLTRLERINDRLATLKQLQRKYGPTMEEVISFQEKIKDEIDELERIEERVAEVELELEKISTRALLKATELSQARKESIDTMEKALESELASLSFNRAVFKVKVGSAKGLGMEGIQATGKDTIEFLFSANPGEPVKPLAKIASGGELSRLTLAMKCILARKDQVDTVIFDEVDSGISGQAAEAVGEKILELAKYHQVICITHLPQIAAGADLHFKIEKKIQQDRTLTQLTQLSEDERIYELARMLAGSEPTATTLDYARELVDRRQKG